jgi:hypothetical protein
MPAHPAEPDPRDRPPPDAATVERPPAPPRVRDDDDLGRTKSAGGWWRIAEFVAPGAAHPNPPGTPGSGSGPPSGQVIRDLDQWVEQNRARIDVGAYKLLHSIGTGAFGAVWEAHDFETGEHVAVKFLSAGDDRWEAMLGEVKFLQALEGTRGIVTVKQVRRGSSTQPPYYVMPLANAGSLADRVKTAKAAAPPDRRGPLVPVAEAVRVFTRLAESLAAVHRRGIHHCDLKPRNVLLHKTAKDQPDEPLIADFGQAHLATDDTPALGTFFYMPPDQADAALRKAKSDSSWDVYALGALLYELLTGDPPRKEDALVRTIKRTEHMDTKLAAYRDGVAAAAPPTAHRPFVDAQLATVLERCLALDPAARPRDGGEVVALLKQRAWWRQVRTPLAVGAAATLVFVLLVTGVSALAADRVYARATEEVGREIDGSLTRTAWYGKGAVERTLQDHVAFVEQHAEVRGKALAELAAAAGRVEQTGEAFDTVTGRFTFDRIVTEAHEHATRRWPGVEGRTVALLVVAGDRPGGGVPARGFTLSRADGNRAPDADRRDPGQEANYRRDWSFRDYFTAAGNRYAEERRPHPVVRHTHVSQTYQSRRDGSWRVDIVTPVWSGDAPGEGRVVGLLSVGLDVTRHLRQLIDMPDNVLADRQEIAKALGAFVVNDRGCWVWHETGMPKLEAEATAGTTPHDPDNLTDLARALAADRGLNPDLLVPWASADRGLESGADAYIDPVNLAATGDGRVFLSHTLTFHPFAHSRYPAVKGRAWGFVVQVPEATALAPVERLRGQLLWAGSILVGTLALLAVVLWVWLFRLLRGWEFAGHG